MSIIDRIHRDAEAVLSELRQRAQVEGWDLARIKREKEFFELGAEVTLCCKPGCLNIAQPIPGFREISCKECEKAGV